MPPQANQFREPQATPTIVSVWLGCMFLMIIGLVMITNWLPPLLETVLAEGLLFGLMSWAAWKTPRTLVRTLLFGANALTVLAFAADQLWLRWEWLSLYASGTSQLLCLAALIDLARTDRINQINQQNESVQ